MTVLENILSQEIIQKLGWTLLHFVWQAAAVALMLAILLKVPRKPTANLRYIISCLALTLIVLLPVITIQLVPVSVSHSTADVEPTLVPPALPTQDLTEAEMPVLEKPVQPEGVALVHAVSWKNRTTELLEPALPYIVLGWLAGVFGLSIWHLGGWAQLQRLRKKMVKQVDAPLHSKLKQLAERLRVNRTVQLAESALVQVPTVVGWLRPVILLPASALTGLSTEQLEAMLAHELAHIKRFDYLVNMLQTVVEILGFYHPAVWWVSHKIRAERENCCDDLAVSVSGDKVSYARALTSMEEIRQTQLAVAATGGSLFARIRRLVGKESTGYSRDGWIPSAVAILFIVALIIPTTLALTARAETKTAPSKETESDKVRVLHFPKDRSLGKLMVRDANLVRRIKDFHYWIDEADWQYFAQAQGDVNIPPGKVAFLYVNETACRDLSGLAGLGPDDLYSVRLPGSSAPGAFKAGNGCMPHIANLTGLRSLHLSWTNIGDRGLKHIQKLKSLEYLNLPDRVTDDGLAYVVELPLLKGLYIKENRITNRGLRHLAKLTSLEELELGGGSINNAALAHLQNLHNLRYLLLWGKNFSDDGMAYLKNIPSLRILNVGALHQLTDAALPYVAEIPNLEAVSFHWSQNITDRGVEHLKKMRSLRKLDVMNSKVTDIGLAHLAQLKTLESLELSRTGITDVGLRHLSNLTNLKKLSVARSHYVDPKMNKEYYTDEGLRALTSCTALEELSIGSIGITDAGMEHIAKLTNLKVLHLFGCDNVTDRGLAKIAELKSLTNLNVSYADVTISGLAQLNSLSNLTRLDVDNLRREGAILDLSGLTNLEILSLGFSRNSGDAFIDADLKCLAGLKKLEWLQLGPRKFSDLGLSYLAGLTNMERLGIGGPEITDEGLKYLTNMEKLNHLSINSGWWELGKRAFGGSGDITDEGLRYLGQIKPLVYLNITSDKDFSPAAVRRLRRELPHLYFLQINGRGILPAGRSGPAYGGAMGSN